MTEIDKEIAKENLFRDSFKGKSCRQVYVEKCYELDVPVNTGVLNMLSPVEDDFEATSFNFRDNIIGTKAIFTLMTIFRINRKLLSLNLSGQGINDAACAQIVDAIKKHHQLHILYISYNPDITDGSANLLFDLLRDNQTVGAIITVGTSLPKAMRRRMDRIAYEHTNLDTIFFRDSTFLDLKQMFITKLDYIGTGILTPLEICGLIDNHRLSLAVADRFAKLGFKRNQKMNCETFMACIHSDFHTLDFLKEHMAKADVQDGLESEAVIALNWSVLEQAAESRNCVLFSLQLVRISHRLLSHDDAREIVDAAIVAMSASRLASGLPPLEPLSASSKIEVTPTLLLPIVADKLGHEEKSFLQSLSKSWSSSGRIKISPSLTKRMYERFLEASSGEVEAEVGSIISVGCQSSTLRLDKVVVRQVLRRNQLGDTINFSFPEWFALVNENYETVFYKVRSRNQFRERWWILWQF